MGAAGVPRGETSQGFLQPGAGPGEGPFPMGLEIGVIPKVGGRPGEQAHAFDEGNFAVRRQSLPMVKGLTELLAVHLDPLTAKEDKAVLTREQFFDLRPGELLAIDNDVNLKIQQRVETERGALLSANRGGHTRTRSPLFPPVRQAHQKPGFFVNRDLFQKLVGLPGGPDERMKDAAGFDEVGHERTAFCRAVQRVEQLDQGGFVFRSTKIRQGFAEGKLGETAGRGHSLGIRSEEGERALRITGIFGEMNGHPAHPRPGRGVTFQPDREAAARGQGVSRPRLHPCPQGEQDVG